MKMNRHTLKKIEAVLEELDYQVIYEKGKFTSGYCLVENQQVAVINRFFDVEARINCIIDILDNIEYDEDLLSKESRKFIFKLSYQAEELPLEESETIEK